MPMVEYRAQMIGSAIVWQLPERGNRKSAICITGLPACQARGQLGCPLHGSVSPGARRQHQQMPRAFLTGDLQRMARQQLAEIGQLGQFFRRIDSFHRHKHSIIS